MIAFCFLLYDEITAPYVWNIYFENIPKDKYRIYCNPKSINLIKNQPLFEDKIIPDRITVTNHGKFSLLTAQNALYKEALKEPGVRFVILIAQNTIPVQSFYSLYSYLHIENKSIIGKYIVHCHQPRYRTMNKPKFNISGFYSMSQWHVLNRHDAEIIVNDYEILKYHFEHMLIPDEHAYVNYLTHCKTTDFINNNICAVYWKSITNKKSNNTYTYDKGVQVFNYISDEHFNDMKTHNHFFIRKITKDIHFNLDHIKTKP